MPKQNIAFNVGSSSVAARTADGRTAERRGVSIDDLGDAARAVCDDLDVDTGDRHVHRVVHGGDLPSPQPLTNDIIDTIHDYSRFATLHNPAELNVIEAVRQRTKTRGVAVFDTSFHQTIPPHRRRYGLPDELTEAGLKQYGFHGISVHGATNDEPGDVICCHLGSGCSVTAVVDGESKATSMGLTPFDGCIMRTRPGRLDPGVVLELCRHDTPDAVDTYLNEECGWEGMANEDLKSLDEHRPKSTTVKAFVDSVAREILAAARALNNPDTMIFTGGVGEHNADLRRRICEQASLLDATIDDHANQANETIISQAGSPVTVKVKPAREEQTMLRLIDAI